MEMKGYKIVVTKAVSQDEQLQMEVHADTPTGLADRLAKGLELLDARLVEQSKRVIDATTFVQNFPPEVRMAVNAIIGTLYGRPGALQEVQVAADGIQKMIREAQEGLPAPSPEPAKEAVTA